MSVLLPVKNYRRIARRCCANCRHWKLDDNNTGYDCVRPGGPYGDWHANEPEFHVCDRWSAERRPGTEES